MPRPTDGAKNLPPSRLCDIAGVARQTREKWVARGLLRDAPHCDQVDLVELVVLRQLFNVIRKSHVPVVWSAIREELRKNLPGQALTVVWDHQRRMAHLSFDDSSIVQLARHGRPVQLILIGTIVTESRDAYRRELAAYTARAEQTSRRPQRQTQRE
jgi:hypothetical protein